MADALHGMDVGTSSSKGVLAALQIEQGVTPEG